MDKYQPFSEESVNIPLNSEGLLCMASQGPGTNSIGSQFFFTLADCSFLNGQYVVIGKVIEGIESLIVDLNNIQTDENDKPKKNITIKNCGDFNLF